MILVFIFLGIELFAVEETSSSLTKQKIEVLQKISILTILKYWEALKIDL